MKENGHHRGTSLTSTPNLPLSRRFPFPFFPYLAWRSTQHALSPFSFSPSSPLSRLGHRPNSDPPFSFFFSFPPPSREIYPPPPLPLSLFFFLSALLTPGGKGSCFVGKESRSVVCFGFFSSFFPFPAFSSPWQRYRKLKKGIPFFSLSLPSFFFFLLFLWPVNRCL